LGDVLARRQRLILLAATAVVLLVPSSASALVVGIADQKPDMFLDKRFGALGIKHARIAVSWDAMRHGWERAEVDRWMFLARLSRVQPLVGFGHSRVNRRHLPTPDQFQREFRKVRRRYPWVKTFATWNEANHCGQPTCHREKLVAAYWRRMRQACPTKCTILAAELLDMPNMRRWARTFRRHAKVEPKVWGLHNYVEANRFKSDRLRTLLRTVKGQVWLTEVGGLVKRRTKKRYTVKAIPESPSHAKRVTDYLFDEVLPGNPRISRVYLYHWNALGPRDSWDSALIGADGRRRPAYDVLARKMRELRAARARR
jgi:hypothetical protein